MHKVIGHDAALEGNTRLAFKVELQMSDAMYVEFKLSITAEAKEFLPENQMQGLVQDAVSQAQNNHIHPADMEVVRKGNYAITVSLKRKKVQIMTVMEASKLGLTDEHRYERN